MKINSTKAIFVMLLCAVSAVQCSKDVLTNSQNISPKMDRNQKRDSSVAIMDLTTIKKLFVDRGIDDKLTSTISQTSKLKWKADWNKPINQNINDSTQYILVPLTPYIITSEGEKAAIMVNTTNYLIIKNNDEYYFGSYESTKGLISGQKIVQDSVDHLKEFTGKFVMINLQSKQSISVDYEKGVLRKKNSTEQKGGLSTQGYQMECHSLIYCTFTAGCDGTFYVYTNMAGCDAPDRDIAVGTCGLANWSYSNSQTRDVCEYVYYPDLPDMPTYPGGTDPYYPQLHPNSYVYQLHDNINLRDYFKCFQTVPNGPTTLYSMVLCADIPNNTEPDWLVNTNTNPGHAFITLNKNDGDHSVTLSFGFYPSISVLSFPGVPVGSMVNDDGAHEYNASVATGLTPAQFQTVLETAEYLAGHSSYDLDDYNCTDYALQVWNSVVNPRQMITVPDWIWPMDSHNFGTTPNGLYNVLIGIRPTHHGTYVSPPKSAPCN